MSAPAKCRNDLRLESDAVEFERGGEQLENTALDQDLGILERRCEPSDHESDILPYNARHASLVSSRATAEQTHTVTAFHLGQPSLEVVERWDPRVGRRDEHQPHVLKEELGGDRTRHAIHQRGHSLKEVSRLLLEARQQGEDE